MQAFLPCEAKRSLLPTKGVPILVFWEIRDSLRHDNLSVRNSSFRSPKRIPEIPGSQDNWIIGCGMRPWLATRLLDNVIRPMYPFSDFLRYCNFSLLLSDSYMCDHLSCFGQDISARSAFPHQFQSTHLYEHTIIRNSLQETKPESFHLTPAFYTIRSTASQTLEDFPAEMSKKSPGPGARKYP